MSPIEIDVNLIKLGVIIAPLFVSLVGTFILIMGYYQKDVYAKGLGFQTIVYPLGLLFLVCVIVLAKENSSSNIEDKVLECREIISNYEKTCNCKVKEK